MNASQELHDGLAELLTYPDDDGTSDLAGTITRVALAYPSKKDSLDALRDIVCGGAPEVLEEVFCRTFDNNTDRALEIGWQIFGENYDRGAFLVRMRGLLRAAGVPETCELPDHLSHVLRALPRIERFEASNLVRTSVLPAVLKILEGFKEGESPYRGVLEFVVSVLETYVEKLEVIDV